MKEPNWDRIKVNLPIQKDSLVWVTKKTRGRFGATMTPAIPGDHGIVISLWTSTMGSQKINILRPDLSEVATTTSCCKIFGDINSDTKLIIDEAPDWISIKLSWMEKTFVPIIVVKEEQGQGRRGRMQYSKRYVASRDGSAMLVKPICSDVKMWVNKDKVHPDDWASLIKSDNRCHSIRVPEWLAKKSGAYGRDK